MKEHRITPYEISMYWAQRQYEREVEQIWHRARVSLRRLFTYWGAFGALFIMAAFLNAPELLLLNTAGLLIIYGVESWNDAAIS